MLDDVVTQTNVYSMQKSGVLINTTRKKTETFIGMYLKLGLVQAHCLCTYWEAGTRYAPIADNMGRDHFLKLASTLYFENNLAVSAEEKAANKIWKLEPWLSDFQ